MERRRSGKGELDDNRNGIKRKDDGMGEVAVVRWKKKIGRGETDRQTQRERRREEKRRCLSNPTSGRNVGANPDCFQDSFERSGDGKPRYSAWM